MSHSTEFEGRNEFTGTRNASRFRPAERLRTPQQYQRVRRRGRRASALHLRIQWAANGLAWHRLGLVVQKRFWNAVQRNRVKRLIREGFRTCKQQLPPPYSDIVVIALPGTETLEPGELCARLRRAMTRENRTL